MTDRTKAMDILIAQDADLIELASGVTEADREVLIIISNSADETAQRIRRGLIYTWEVRQIANHREQAAAEERAKIVAWLRNNPDVYDWSPPTIAAAIIDEEHLDDRYQQGD